jgi:uncharacterized protein (DUF1800 family)
MAQAHRSGEASSLVYGGPFGTAQAERLLWRAGFGPRPGEAKALARKGLRGAVHSLTRSGPERLHGPAPRDESGQPLAPEDAYGHDHLWWLDRMVRTDQPLLERMTLVWHDWFATSNAGVGSQRLMLAQNRLFRSRALGTFEKLLLGVTKDPAMLLWLSGNQNTKDSPNENYARELMELFTLGADRPGGFSEQDVREQARALTGWTNDFSPERGPYYFRFVAYLHDYDFKTIFGHTGAFDWKDSCWLCLRHPNHPSFFVEKLWSYFVAGPPPAGTQSALERLYVSSGYAIRPVVEAILMHPQLYVGPRMVKPPVVYTAGLLRALGRGIDTSAWLWLDALSGQQLFYPPNVSGWDDSRWLDTATFRGRWLVASRALAKSALDENGRSNPPHDPAKLLDWALARSGRPAVAPETRAVLLKLCTRALADAEDPVAARMYQRMAVNAVRILFAVAPEQQTS